MKKILFSLIAIVTCIAAMGSAFAYMVDTETSAGNTFDAGELNLTIDDQDGVNVVKFGVSNYNVGSQTFKVIKLTNIGSIAGILDISNITLDSQENTNVEPEQAAGDSSTPQGELQNALSLRMFWSENSNISYETGDRQFFSDKFGALPTSMDTDEPLLPGATIYLVCQVNWFNNGETIDSQAMTDSLAVGFTFKVVEGTGSSPTNLTEPSGY